MFWQRHPVHGRAGSVDLAFTDRHGGVSGAPFDSLDLGDGSGDAAANLARVADALGVDAVVTMRQVHGAGVAVVSSADEHPSCDALVAARAPGLALAVRVADCVPVLLADPDAGVVGAVHAGRAGVAADVVGAAVGVMREQGASAIQAWVGPHVCGGCYEVPAAMRADVAAAEPTTFACTRWGTPALDLGAGVVAQLEREGCTVEQSGACTVETPHLYSYRRDGAASGRFAGLVVWRAQGDSR